MLSKSAYLDYESDDYNDNRRVFSCESTLSAEGGEFVMSTELS